MQKYVKRSVFDATLQEVFRHDQSVIYCGVTSFVRLTFDNNNEHLTSEKYARVMRRKSRRNGKTAERTYY